MVRPDTTLLRSARFWTIVQAVLVLLLAAGFKFTVELLEQAPDRLPDWLMHQLADATTLLFGVGCALLVIAWGLTRLQWWAVIAGVLYHAFLVFRDVTTIAGGDGHWIFWGSLALSCYVLFLLLHPGSLAAVGLWRRSAAPMPRPSAYQGPGYQTPAYEPAPGYEAPPPTRW